MPDSHFVYLLDFSQRRFVKKKLSSKLPMRFTSAQTLNGNIYVVGGMLPDQNF